VVGRSTCRCGILLAFMVSSVYAQSAKPGFKYHGPSCLGEFCFNKTLVAEDKFATRYGETRTLSQRDLLANGVYCYRVPQQNLFARFDATLEKPGLIVGVFVTRLPTCTRQVSETRLPKQAFAEFVTKEGVQLGDSEAKVVSLYGRPDSIANAAGPSEKLYKREFGERVLRYTGAEGDLLFSEFYVQQGRVSAIFIGAGS
jgi:hypothetical protein